MMDRRTIRKVDAVIATCERAEFSRGDWALLAIVAASEAGLSSRVLREVGATIAAAVAVARPKRRRRSS
jgi:hypothetical protein